MGYSKLLFVDAAGINEEFLCAICLEVLKRPIMLAACEHVFCKARIDALERNSDPEEQILCPMDRMPIAHGNELRKPHRAFLNLLNALQRKCQFAEFGCEATFSLGDTNSHEDGCDANPEFKKPCNDNCGAMLTKNEVAGHSCMLFLKKSIDTLTEKMKTMEALIYQTPLDTRLESDIIGHATKIMDRMVKKNGYGNIPDGNRGSVQDFIAESAEDVFGGKWTCDIRGGYYPFPTKSFRAPLRVQFYHKGYIVRMGSSMASLN